MRLFSLWATTMLGSLVPAMWTCPWPMRFSSFPWCGARGALCFCNIEILTTCVGIISKTIIYKDFLLNNQSSGREEFFFRGSEVERKLLRHLFFSYWASQHGINSWVFFSSSSFWWGFGLSVQHTTFCRGVELGFFPLSCVGGCFFYCAFFHQAVSLKRVVGVLLSVLGALVTESEANQISEVYDVTAYHCAWNLGISKKNRNIPPSTETLWLLAWVFC